MRNGRKERENSQDTGAPDTCMLLTQVAKMKRICDSLACILSAAVENYG